jgi:hypothetical protein
VKKSGYSIVGEITGVLLAAGAAVGAKVGDGFMDGGGVIAKIVGGEIKVGVGDTPAGAVTEPTAGGCSSSKALVGKTVNVAGGGTAVDKDSDEVLELIDTSPILTSGTASGVKEIDCSAAQPIANKEMLSKYTILTNLLRHKLARFFPIQLLTIGIQDSSYARQVIVPVNILIFR